MPAGLHTETLRPHIAGARSYPIFISSGQDASALRDRVERVVQDCLNTQLSLNAWPIYFPIWRWENVEARAAQTGSSVNDTFVQMARESSVVIVLLHDELRPGTREELLAVKDDGDVDLKILWFPKRRFGFLRRRSSVEAFLSGHEMKLLHAPLGAADSEKAWIGLVRNLVATLLKALRSEARDPYVEDR